MIVQTPVCHYPLLPSKTLIIGSSVAPFSYRDDARAEIKKKPEDIIDRNETFYKVKSETSYFLSKDFKELFGKKLKKDTRAGSVAV